MEPSNSDNNSKFNTDRSGVEGFGEKYKRQEELERVKEKITKDRASIGMSPPVRQGTEVRDGSVARNSYEDLSTMRMKMRSL